MTPFTWMRMVNHGRKNWSFDSRGKVIVLEPRNIGRADSIGRMGMENPPRHSRSRSRSRQSIVGSSPRAAAASGIHIHPSSHPKKQNKSFIF
jgi:hypothetical protein